MITYRDDRTLFQQAHCKLALILLLVSVWVLTFTVSAASQATPDLPFPRPNSDSLSIEEALLMVERYELSTYDAESTLLRAGASDERRHAVVLRRIVKRYADSYPRLSFTALHALWLLDEPQAYFVRLAEQHNRNPRLAYYAVWVLARAPDEKTFEKLSVIREATIYGLLDSGINTYEDMLGYELEYHERSFQGEPITPELRLLTMAYLMAEGYQFLAHGSSGDLPVVEGDPNSHLHPRVVWARDKLRKLAARHEEETWQMIHSLAADESLAKFNRGDLSQSEWQVAVAGFQAHVQQTAFPKGIKER